MGERLGSDEARCSTQITEYAFMVRKPEARSVMLIAPSSGLGMVSNMMPRPRRCGRWAYGVGKASACRLEERRREPGEGGLDVL